VNVETRFLKPGAPWENGYIDSFNGTLRNELLSREVFGPLLEARVLGGKYRQEYNTERPHSSLDYQTPTEFAATQVENSALTPTLV
jgi:transposase InsO family protein